MEILSLIPVAYSKFIVYVLIFTRIAALLCTFVLFKRDLITSRIIISLATILSFYVLMFYTGKQINYDVFSLQMLIQLLFQVLVGILGGLILNIVFDVFIAVGQLVSTQVGLGIASLIDQRFGYITSLTQFYIILCSLLFLFMNGHLYAIHAVLTSFDTLPIYEELIPQHLINNILNYAGVIFSGSLILSINVVMILMLTNIALAIMTKFAPQFNLFTIGINMELIIGLICIYITLTILINNGSILIQDNLDLLRKLFTKTS